jgi:hypothetical protein
MRFFKRKKSNPEKAGFSPPCPNCLSNSTRIISQSRSEGADYVKIWRGQRYLTCRCSDCGKDFYAAEPAEGLTEESVPGDEIVSDPDELRAAEEELKREVEEENDHMCG